MLLPALTIYGLGGSESDHSAILPGFGPVFKMASKDEYFNRHPWMRLEYGPKSFAILGNYLFPSP